MCKKEGDREPILYRVEKAARSMSIHLIVRILFFQQKYTLLQASATHILFVEYFCYNCMTISNFCKQVYDLVDCAFSANNEVFLI